MPTSAATVRATSSAVAGEHVRAQPQRAQPPRPRRALVGATVSATLTTPPSAPSQATTTAVAPARSAVRTAAVGARRCRRPTGQRATPVGRPARAAVDDGLHAEPGAGPEVVGDRVVRRPRRRPPGATGCSDAASAAAATGEDLVLGDAAPRRSTPCTRHPPGGDGAGLVEHDGVDAAGGLEHLRGRGSGCRAGRRGRCRRAARSAWPGRGRRGRR